MSRRSRRAASSALACAALGLLALPLLSQTPPGDPPIMVVDLHVDLPYQVHQKSRPPTLSEGHTTSSFLREGAYGGIVLPIYLADYLNGDGARVEDAEAVLATIEGLVPKNPIFLPLRSARAEPGRISTFLSIEGAGAFAADVKKVDRFIERGVRLIGPVHAGDGPLASSATGKKPDEGLTAAGEALCDRIYEKGALVDVSHLSDKGIDELLPIAQKHGAPIVATHSNARAVAAHPRNLTDAHLAMIGRTGGVAGANFHTPFVTTKKEAGIDDVVRQIEHMVKVAGVDHVAIGSDFDGGIKPATGLEDASKLPALAAALKKRGMPHDDVLKIFSLNALRVLGWRPRGGLPPP